MLNNLILLVISPVCTYAMRDDMERCCITFGLWPHVCSPNTERYLWMGAASHECDMAPFHWYFLHCVRTPYKHTPTCVCVTFCLCVTQFCIQHYLCLFIHVWFLCVFYVHLVWLLLTCVTFYVSFLLVTFFTHTWTCMDMCGCDWTPTPCVTFFHMVISRGVHHFML